MKGYIILEKGFEYNDEIYNSSEGGNPLKIYLSYDFAKKEYQRLTIQKFKTINITDYDYDVSNLCDNLEALTNLCESLNKKYGTIERTSKWDSVDEYRLHPLANDEESKKYCALVDLQFYEICQSEFDTDDLRDSKLNHLIE
jgi:hypothetical protein